MSSKTLFGEVPNDWTVVTIGDIAILQQGLQIAKELRKDIPSEDYIPLLMITDLPTGKFSEYVTNIKQQHIANKDDIIFTRTGQVGLVYTNVFGCVHNNCFKVIVDYSKFDKIFIYYFLKSSHVYEFANQVASGSVQKDLKHSAFKTCPIGFPEKKEQKAIAATLSCLDDKIELNNRINKTFEEMAQAIFKSWFVDFEPFQDGEFEDSELGRIPKGWRVKPLGILCKVITKGTTPTTLKRQFTSEGINFIKAESILSDHSFDLNKFAFIDGETNVLLNRSIIFENDILFTIAGTLGRFALVDSSILPANTNQAVAIIRANDQMINPIALYSYFLGNWHVDFYKKRIQQAVQANLSLTTIKSLPIIIPSEKILEEYIDLITPIYSLLSNNSLEKRKLVEARDTLLPKLMSGEIRVPIQEVD